MLKLVEESLAYDVVLQDKTRRARTCREPWETAPNKRKKAEDEIWERHCETVEEGWFSD